MYVLIVNKDRVTRLLTLITETNKHKITHLESHLQFGQYSIHENANANRLAYNNHFCAKKFHKMSACFFRDRKYHRWNTVKSTKLL